MKTHRNGDHGRATDKRWTAPTPCPPSAGHPADREMQPDAIDDYEAAVLQDSVRKGNAVLHDKAEQIKRMRAEAIRSFHTAQSAVWRVQAAVARGDVKRTSDAIADVDDFHQFDGVEDRRARVKVPRVAFYGLLLLSVLFDSAFIASVVRRILDVPPDDRLLNVLVYTPGLGIAVGLWIAGALLGTQLFRRRMHQRAQLVRSAITPWTVLRRLFWEWRREAVRKADDVPWQHMIGPIVFTAGVLAMLGLWAYFRAATASERLGQYKFAFVVLLLMMSAAVIVLKVMMCNPYAERAARTKRNLLVARVAADLVMSRALKRLSEHASALTGLETAVAEVRQQAWAPVEEGRAQLLKERSARGTRGRQPLPLRPPLNVCAVPTRDSADAADNGGADLDWTLLNQAQKTLCECSAEPLRTALDDAADALRTQLRPPGRDKPATDSGGNGRHDGSQETDNSANEPQAPDADGEHRPSTTIDLREQDNPT